MFTLGTIKKWKDRRLSDKTAILYFLASVFCIITTNIYALFGHGVRSAYMDTMFLYPLLCGGVAFLSAAKFSSLLPKRLRKGSRAGYNLYNSGVASLTSASMLKGIMEIAGTDSKWIRLIEAFGFLLLAAAIVFVLRPGFERKENKL